MGGAGGAGVEEEGETEGLISTWWLGFPAQGLGWPK